MYDIFLMSDPHFGHNRPFIYGARGFNSIEDMNEAIIQHCNEVMDKLDDIYILGDCFFNDNEEGIKYVRKIPGTKHIIWGNHDTDARKKLLIDEGFDCIGYAHVLKCRGYTFYLSHYPTMTDNHDEDKPLKRRILSISGHTHSKNVWDAAGGYNVALDAHNCYPTNIEDIIKAFEERATTNKF